MGVKPNGSQKLRLAGADRVVAPQVVGSERLAAMAMNAPSHMFDVVIAGAALIVVDSRIELSTGC